MTTAPQFRSSPNDQPEQSQAIVALMLGILGIALIGIFGPLAWVIGNRELTAIDAGRRPWNNRSTAILGRLLGIVATVLLLGAVLLFVFALVGIVDVS